MLEQIIPELGYYDYGFILYLFRQDNVTLTLIQVNATQRCDAVKSVAVAVHLCLDRDNDISLYKTKALLSILKLSVWNFMIGLVVSRPYKELTVLRNPNVFSPL